MKVLVTGACGYIGSVLVEMLTSRGFEVVTLDACFSGRSYLNIPHLLVDVKDIMHHIGIEDELQGVEHVVHLAGFAYVNESIANPMMYYNNNVLGTINLLNVLDKFSESHKIEGITFASSCSVYGDCGNNAKVESEALSPQSPYAASKVMCEEIIRDYVREKNNKENKKFYGTIFRFFNVAGATKMCGDFHNPETHIIPNLIKSAFGEKQVVIWNNGEDIREYVHVCDVCEAIISSINNVCDYSGTHTYNLGGQSISTGALAEFAEEFFGRKLNLNYDKTRRTGDVCSARSCSGTAKLELVWRNERSTIPNIFRTQTEFYESKRHLITK